ncbi:hydroxyisourate hydrolase [Zhihengliuella salsuginis]|uniref:5-hydroxyisourate hydrolase n=1 Tax=Zhihengliuella salsuginis TaxID=578222 RepID=A0ABQ3GM10_9MICC|nr:hydroxyisourate hydrolase [Zhihengliuella salsuginis]GHD12364.1 5-hydroxyisourate hydrolase [Zhihengliuella salsuginis]
MNASGHTSHITTHVLDTAAGRPAAGIAATLEAHAPDGWRQIGTGTTDDDGRISDLSPPAVEPGTYRITFTTGDYFAAQGSDSFFPEVVIAFRVSDPGSHYHVPLLISPFAYSTYRGS